MSNTPPSTCPHLHPFLESLRVRGYSSATVSSRHESLQLFLRWLRYLRGVDEQGQPYHIDDPRTDELQRALDQIQLEFSTEALHAIAEAALRQNLGARALRGILEKVLHPGRCFIRIFLILPAEREEKNQKQNSGEHNREGNFLQRKVERSHKTISYFFNNFTFVL